MKIVVFITGFSNPISIRLASKATVTLQVATDIFIGMIIAYSEDT